MTPKYITERLDWKHFLKKLGFSLESAQPVVWNHGYDTAKKISCLKSYDVDILIKTLQSPGWGDNNETKDLGIYIPHMVQCNLTFACFTYCFTKFAVIFTPWWIPSTTRMTTLCTSKWHGRRSTAMTYCTRTVPSGTPHTPSNPLLISRSMLSHSVDQVEPHLPICSGNTLFPWSTSMRLIGYITTPMPWWLGNACSFPSSSIQTTIMESMLIYWIDRPPTPQVSPRLSHVIHQAQVVCHIPTETCIDEFCKACYFCAA